jgi:hypothetical protein
VEIFGGYSAKEGQKRRKELLKSLDRDIDTRHKKRVEGLKTQEKEIRGNKRDQRKRALAACGVRKKKQIERARQGYRAAVERARVARIAKIAAARERCSAERAGVVALHAELRQVRGVRLDATQEHRALKRAESTGRKRAAPRRRGIEAIRESEDAVLAELDERIVPLWERVKNRIRGSARMSRAEAMKLYAEEHPEEVIRALEEDAEKELEREILREQRRVDEELKLDLARVDLTALEEKRPKGKPRTRRPSQTQRELMDFFGSLVVAG